MAITDSYKDYITDQLQYIERIGHVSIRKMFGGAGIYFDGLIFGIINDEDVLFFKVDDSNRTDYEEVVENKESLAGWAIKAIEVSQRTPRKKRKNRTLSDMTMIATLTGFINRM